MLLRRHHKRDDEESPHTTETEDGPATAPARSASKAEWIAYAVSQGADQADAEQLTKEQLTEQYGG
ncbi:hypothetical protein OG864_29725 [Streptomyces sp. NBC_00124]|uniref:hypothetical protein n=1 Tax=Streptomyces sp. NBC_00124 TaxID=2975662 RepID=UPI0022511EA6|nr:hypothetical protein [Streptomyces sp. NBC_00124]MCX5362881.1 hypothetical protein [Streptomyces sp. NBC_00124]